MKDIILVVMILLSIFLSVMVMRFNDKATKVGKNLDEERYSRMVAEQSLLKNTEKLASIERQLKTATDKMSKVQDILDQEKNVNQELKDQYEKLSKTKAELEDKLQETIRQQAAIEQAVESTAVTPDPNAANTEAVNAEVPATP